MKIVKKQLSASLLIDEEKELPRERGRQLGRLLIDTAVDLERDMLGKK